MTPRLGVIVLFLTVWLVCEGQDVCPDTAPVRGTVGNVMTCVDGVAGVCPPHSSCRGGVCCFDSDPIAPPPPPPRPLPPRPLCPDQTSPLNGPDGGQLNCGLGGTPCPDDATCINDPGDRFSICCNNYIPVCAAVVCEAPCVEKRIPGGCPECLCDEIKPCTNKDPECPTNHTCQTKHVCPFFGPCLQIAECVPDVCPEIECTKDCKLEKNSYNCPVCQCVDPCQDPEMTCAEGEEFCMVHTAVCSFPCPVPIPKMAECVPCPDIQCTKNCKLDKNSDNCPVCQCVDPCQEMTCDAGQYCEVITAACTSRCPHPVKKEAQCVDIPVCPAVVCEAPCMEKRIPGGCPECLCDEINPCRMRRDVGMCRGMFKRYHFNPDSQKCEGFYYGGCGGNKNNFNSLDDCMRRCSGATLPPIVTVPPLITILPPEDPLCVTAILSRGRCPGGYSFYYNTRRKSCKKLRRRWCSRNDNKFTNKRQCEEACVRRPGGRRRPGRVGRG